MLYTGDWLKDPDLRRCQPLTRGIWIDILCYMHENDKSGVLKGTLDQLSRMCSSNERDMRFALEDLSITGTAVVTFPTDVTDSHNEVTIENGRMQREAKTRAGNCLRKRAQRAGEEVTPEVTTPYSIAPSIAVSTASNITDELAQILAYFPDGFFPIMTIPELLLKVKKDHGDDALRAMCEKVANIKDPGKRNGGYVRTIIKNTDLAGIKTGRVSETGDKLEWLSRLQCVALTEGNTNGRTTDDLYRALKDENGDNIKFPDDHRYKGLPVWVKK